MDFSHSDFFTRIFFHTDFSPTDFFSHGFFHTDLKDFKDGYAIRYAVMLW